MFWLRGNKLAGSYLFFKATSLQTSLDHTQPRSAPIHSRYHARFCPLSADCQVERIVETLMTPQLEGLVVLWPILLLAEDTTSMFLHVSFRVRRITNSLFGHDRQ